MNDLIIAIDQGTTGTTVLIVDEHLTVRSRAYRELPQIYPRPGEVEHDPEAIWATVTGALGEALARIDVAKVRAIGITNQRETTLLWDRETGRPVANAIVWQDRRTADACAALKRAGHEALVRARTGPGARPLLLGDEDPLAARQRRRPAPRAPRPARSRSAPSTAS